MRFSTFIGPNPLVFMGKFHPEILTGSPKQGHQTTEGWAKMSHFPALNVTISKTVGDTYKATSND